MQHINDLSLHIELPWTLSKAEGIYHQLAAVAPNLPDNVRIIIGYEPLNNESPTTSDLEDESNASGQDQTLKANNSRRNSNTSGNITLGNNEVAFERGLNTAYLWIVNFF